MSGEPVAASPADDELAWRTALLDWRRRWERHLKRDTSPLSTEARARFPGSFWFDPDPAYRLRELKLARHAAPRPAPLASTGSEGFAWLEIGVLELALHGRACRLLVFEPAPGEVEETYFFVPFRDETSGRESYGGGRYLDLDPTASDVYDVDFNRAYFPYCAHDEAWSCTIPPPENRLPVPVRAGERFAPSPS